MNFFGQDNLCCQNLLRLTSRGSAIIAELLRLSTNIPSFFTRTDSFTEAGQTKYNNVLFDFQYFLDPDEYEKNITNSDEMIELDQEFLEVHEEILNRFYRTFESIWIYQADLFRFIEDVKGGFYIYYSLDIIFQEVEGKQLLCEALYLYGNMLLLLEEKFPGPVREKMLVLIYRHNGEGRLINIQEVCKLCRSTGYIPGPQGKRPKSFPETIFSRFPPDSDLVKLAIGNLQADDIYLMSSAYPNPEQRSTRLANQASMLFVILYFSFHTLQEEKITMREIVDKYFNDQWMIPTYMGRVVDLLVEWDAFPAAKYAIRNIVTVRFVKKLNDKNTVAITKSLDELKKYLKEGVLQSDFLLDNLTDIINVTTTANVALRWRILHRLTKIEQFRSIIHHTISPQMVVTLLFSSAQLEYNLKQLLKEIIDSKEVTWEQSKSTAASRIDELSHYFTGEKALTTVKIDQNMTQWFSNLSTQIRALDTEEIHSTATGRKIRGIIMALQDVEQFEALDTNLQIKSFLGEVRDILHQMIRTVNIKASVLDTLETVSDFSYAWETLPDYLDVFHDRVRQEPSCVVLLRATFLKTVSILDVPLVRITAVESPDAESVAEYYSNELVDFVKKVLEVFPVSVFDVLKEIVNIQTHQLLPLPVRLEAKDLKLYAQFDLRFQLSKLTHQMSVLTEGVLLMDETLLGVIQVNPKQILIEGIRRELVKQIAMALHHHLVFTSNTRNEIHDKLGLVVNSLGGLQRSMEHIQDYLDVAGLKLYYLELSRVIGYNAEQEANRYLQRKTFDEASRYQSKAIPIPKLKLASVTEGSGTNTNAINFMGRLLSSLLYLTDSTRTFYAPEKLTWFAIKEGGTTSKNPPPPQAMPGLSGYVEVCGLHTFSLVEKAMGPVGIQGLDRMIAFRTSHILNDFLSLVKTEVNVYNTALDQFQNSLFPLTALISEANKIYISAIKQLEKVFLPLLKVIRRVGQSQLLRKNLSLVLRFGSQLDAHQLHNALATFNLSLLSDIRKEDDNQQHQVPLDQTHERDQPTPTLEEQQAINKKTEKLLYETTALLDATGLDDPLHKVYCTSSPIEKLPELLFLFLLYWLPKLEFNDKLGTLTRKKSIYPLDGTPMIVGLACVLRQFHPALSNRIIDYCGQYIRSHLHETSITLPTVDSSSKSVDSYSEDINSMIVFLDQLCDLIKVPRVIFHEYSQNMLISKNVPLR